MRPPLEGQVSPAPWLVARSRVDVPALIRKALASHPNAGVDDIVGQLAAWGVQVSGIIVSMWMMKSKQEAEQARPDDLAGKAAGNAVDAALYCTCDEDLHLRKPVPSWWHQYCCGVRVTKQQIKARDKFVEHAAR